MNAHTSLGFTTLLTATALFAAAFPSTVKAQNISKDKRYAYIKVVPGQPPDHYMDDGSAHGVHDVHSIGLGTFDRGNLTDGVVSTSAGTGPGTNHIAIRGPAANAPPANIIIDLGGPSIINEFVIGTVVAAGLNNNAPDDVIISYSTTGFAPSDFSSPKTFDLEAMFGPLADGHHDMKLAGNGTLARYVKFKFDGGSMAEPNGTDPDEKWLLDEITINGSFLGCTASSWNYGAGLAGGAGVPTLTLSAPPKLGTSVIMNASNSSGTATRGLVLVGIDTAWISFLGGRMLVQPTLQTFLPIPAGGLVLPFTVPNTGACLDVFVQVLQIDAAASGGVSMTRGLNIGFGG